MKAQLKLGETVEDRARIEAEAEEIRQAVPVQPIPEYRHYYGNWGIRIPMELRVANMAEKTVLLIELDQAINLQDPDIIHEIHHHTEKLNMALALAAKQAPTKPVPGQPCKNCDTLLEDCRTAPERGFQGGCCPECDHKAEAQT